MARNQFSDITLKKRSIRDIPLPNSKQPVRPVEETYENEVEHIKVEDGYFAGLGAKKPRKKKYLWLIIILVGLGFWGASVFLHAATVRITPQKAEFTGVIDIVANADATPAEIQYDSLQFTQSASKKVPASAEEDVAIKASGTIIIYNNHSTTPQELVANTRFETPAGKIYRIQKVVNVPGYKTVDGAKVPGSVEAVVYADAAGESYNSAKTDFTIPGFKGTPKYTGFYARSTTDVTGGFIGKQKKVDAKLLASTTAQLQAEILAKVDQSIVGNIPSDFVFIKGGSNVSYITKPVTADGSDGVVTVEGTITAYVFKKTDLNQALLKATSESDLTSIVISDYGALTLSNIKENVAKKTLSASIGGNVTGYAEIDRNALAQELTGIKKSTIGTVMNTHPEIVSSRIFIRPPWMFSLPNNPERIHITEEIGS